MTFSMMYGIPQIIYLLSSILYVILESIVTLLQNIWFSNRSERVKYS